MLKKIICILSVFISLHNLSYAESGEDLSNKFLVNDIKVDEVSETAELARKNAIIYAHKKAFDILTARIFADTITEEFSEEQISSLVEAIEFKDEVITDKRYTAVIDVSFQLEQTQFFINNNLLNKRIEMLSAVIIPVFNENGMYKLWQRSNFWFDSWLRADKSSMIDFKLLSGDLSDMSNFRVANIDNISSEKLQQLKLEYNVDRIIVAEVEYLYNNIDENTKLNLYYKDLEQGFNRNLIKSIDSDKQEGVNLHLDSLVKVVVSHMEVEWMNYNDVTENANKQDFIIKFSDLAELLEIQKAIEELSLVKTLEIHSFSSRYAKVSVDFIEKPIEIFELMKDLGFKISREQNYVIIESR